MELYPRARSSRASSSRSCQATSRSMRLTSGMSPGIGSPGPAAPFSHPWPPVVPIRLALEDPRGPQERVLGERRGQELQADRQVVPRQPAGDGQAGDTGEVGGDRVDVRQVHRQGVGRPLSQLERGRRRRRPKQDVDLAEGGVEVAADLAANLKRLVVVLVGVPGRECEGAQHDPPLDLRPEALGPADHHHPDQRGEVSLRPDTSARSPGRGGRRSCRRTAPGCWNTRPSATM